MTYAAGGTIQATDYNGFVASVNSLWGTGSGSTGYGQESTLATVSAAADTVTATQWSGLITRINTISQHQTGSESEISAPSAGTTITYLSTLSSTIATLTANRANAIATSAAVSANVANSTVWNTVSTKEISFTWANANAMRHWFNAGGYISFTGKNSSLSGNTASTTWDSLLTACGDIVVRATSSEKIGGSGTTAVNNTNLGFHNLTTSYQTIIQQFGSASGYTLNHVQFQAKINEIPGTSTSISLRMILTDAYNSVGISGTASLTYSYYSPSTTYISNVWGEVSVDTITNTNLSSILKSDVGPLLYNQYNSFMTGGAVNGTTVPLTLKTARTTTVNGSSSRDLSTINRSMTLQFPYSLSYSPNTSTVLLITGTDDATTNPPTAVTLNGTPYSPTSWFQGGNGTHGTVRTDYFYYNGNINNITSIAGTFDGPGGNDYGVQTIVVIPGQWSFGTTVSGGGDDGGTTPTISLSQYDLFFFWSARGNDAISNVSLAGSNYLEIGRNQGRWYNGITIGIGYATNNVNNLTSSTINDGIGLTGIGKMAFVSG